MDVAIDISDVILETDRLLLRPWEDTDADDLYEYASVPGVGEMAGWIHHESVEVSRNIVKAFRSEKNVFAIVYKENHKVIGSLGLHVSWANDEKPFAPLKVKEIGYVLSKAYWGQGLMPEAVKAVITFCFHQLNLDALTVGHFAANHQSRRVIEKCGFSFVRQSEYYAQQLEQTFEDAQYILYR